MKKTKASTRVLNESQLLTDSQVPKESQVPCGEETQAVLNELNHYLYTYHGGHYLRSRSKDNSQTDADAFEYSQR